MPKGIKQANVDELLFTLKAKQPTEAIPVADAQRLIQEIEKLRAKLDRVRKAVL